MINNAIKFIFETFKIIIRLLPLKKKLKNMSTVSWGNFQSRKQNKTKQKRVSFFILIPPSDFVP